ncbi:tetratricopeptide repeat protein [Paraburkholderia sp.]|uniref:tetratricopeptide repeat protein n=1 Tax=Paraburkholderia sp. TaxID=1926495 RepID=UPI0023A3F6AC|nr:tetratricopeptide repeat protein [Paraburkholderia sp.]MDE1184645.1 pilus assembly protein [Paraburkholderia sp.]
MTGANGMKWGAGALRAVWWTASLTALALTGACASKLDGYGVGAQAERQAMIQQAGRDPAPDTPGVYLGLIDRMQSQGLYFASLAHIDQYEKQYGASPDTILLRADALRLTDQPQASAQAYAQLLSTPLAARGYRGLGLLAGASGDFAKAAQQLGEAAQRAPTDASVLSDLGYAQLRNGDVAAARVPLMKAAELDQQSPKIVSNVALYLLASGDAAQAQALIEQQKLAPDVRAAIRSDAAQIATLQRSRQRASAAADAASANGNAGGSGSGGVSTQAAAAPAPRGATQADVQAMLSAQGSAQGIDKAPRMLQRFAQ